jgi:membrane-bound inhibitor of C-type lysozyme
MPLTARLAYNAQSSLPNTERLLQKPILILCLLSLAGCSEVKVWPFDRQASGRPAALANATEYTCEGGKRFFVRYLDNGATAWLIYPDREVGLTRTLSGATTRYTNGVAVLEVTGNEATLRDGDRISYTGCRTGAAPR